MAYHQPVPLTLSIMPTTHNHSQPLQFSNHNLTQNIKVNNNQHIPTFNHVPMQPVIVAPVRSGIDKKERIRLQKKCESTKRYNERTKEYKKIANLYSEKEKITAVVLLCYPHIDPVVAQSHVDRFVDSLLTL